MARIIIDYDPPFEGAGQIEGDSSNLVYFLSWAYSARYGANHELSLVAQTLRNDFAIDLKPLLTFADRDVEEPADEEQLERSWQDGAPLADVCRLVVNALTSDDMESVRAGYPLLQPNVAELGRLAEAAAGAGCRIRVTFELT